jgi:toxin YoeB
MGKFVVIIEPTAKVEIKFHLKSGNRAFIKKIEKIILELTESPFTGTQNPEALK